MSLWKKYGSGEASEVKRTCDTTVRDRRESLQIRKTFGISRHEDDEEERIFLRISHVKVFRTVAGILCGVKGGGVRWNFGRRHCCKTGSQTTKVLALSKTGGEVSRLRRTIEGTLSNITMRERDHPGAHGGELIGEVEGVEEIHHPSIDDWTLLNAIVAKFMKVTWGNCIGQYHNEAKKYEQVDKGGKNSNRNRQGDKRGRNNKCILLLLIQDD